MRRLPLFVRGFCLLLLITLTLSVTAQAPRSAPDNDNFENAQEIVLNAKYKVTDVHEATQQGGEPGPCTGASVDNSVWYKFTSPFQGAITISTGGSYITNPPFGNYTGAFLAVYTGSSLGTLSGVGCGGFEGIAILNVMPGTTYYFRITPSESPIGAGSYYKLKTSVLSAWYYPPLVNASFEDGSNGWKVKNADNGDGPSCGVDDPFNGSCAFKFVGGADEATKLQQKIAWPAALTGKRDHGLSLSPVVKPTAATGTSLKITLVVSYTDGTPKTKNSMTVTSAFPGVYDVYAATVLFASADIADVKAVFKNQSVSGSVLVDDVVLFYYGSFGRETVSALPVPLPAQ